MMTLEYDAAAARFDADLIIAAGTAPAAGTHRLRKRAVGVYRNALTCAAGRPGDPRWRILELVVGAFLCRVADAPHSPESAAALARLERLRRE